MAEPCDSEPGRSRRSGSGACCCWSSSPCSRRRIAPRKSIPSSTSSTRTSAMSRPSSAVCGPTCTSPASSSATTSSTPSASARRSIANSWPRSARTTSPPSPTSGRSRLAGLATKSDIASLEAKLDEYWQAFDPLFDWTLVEKISQSASFLRREVLPRREAVLAIAMEIEDLNNANHAVQRAEVTRRHEAFRSELRRLIWGSLFLGLVVALTAVIRLRVLERRSENERAVAEEAEHLMRQLSHQLVATQEEERKNLSRELHDHVGQMLTALRMELGRIDRLRSSPTSCAKVSMGPRGSMPRRTTASPAPSPSAGSSWTTWSAPSAISRSACGPACWTTSVFSPRSNGTCATSGAASVFRSSSRSTATSTSCPSSTAPASTARCRRRSPTACATRARRASRCRSAVRPTA